ncbi:Hypothetical protein YALI2_A00097g [Yarrowia lipolytica]|nr:Hypothetical protein YALI2_A00097g [Yarrowia lipolytica]
MKDTKPVNNENYDPNGDESNHNDTPTIRHRKTPLKEDSWPLSGSAQGRQKPTALKASKPPSSTDRKIPSPTDEEIAEAWAAHPGIPPAEVSIKIMQYDDSEPSEICEEDFSLDSQWLSMEIDRIMREQTDDDISTCSFQKNTNLGDAYSADTSLFCSDSSRGLEMDMSNISKELARLKTEENRDKEKKSFSSEGSLELSLLTSLCTSTPYKTRP